MTLFRRTYTEQGAPPGTIVEPAVSVPPEIHVISFTQEDYEEHDARTPEAIRDVLGAERVVWIDVRGLGDGTIARELGALLDLHPLAVADVIHVGQRPKVDLYDGVLFVVLHMVTLGSEGRPHWEQVSVFLGSGYVLTFQEAPGDCLDPLRERIRQAKGRIRAGGADYLACMVIDSIVDGYFPVLEQDAARLEAFEEQILSRPTYASLATLYETKRDLATFRREVWPLREALLHLMRDDELPVSESARAYLRDTTDHVMQVADLNETYRELAASLIDVYLSMVGQRTNDIMRVLTVVAAIFIPLTFLAGIYGMNFDTDQPLNMPELGWSFGYLYFWMICLGVGGVLLYLFWRLGWLGTSGR